MGDITRLIVLIMIVLELCSTVEAGCYCSCESPAQTCAIVSTSFTTTPDTSLNSTSDNTTTSDNTASDTSLNCTCPIGYAASNESCFPSSRGIKCLSCSSSCRTCNSNDITRCTSCKYLRIGFTINITTDNTPETNSTIPPPTSNSTLNTTLTSSDNNETLKVIELQQMTENNSCTSEHWCSTNNSCPTNTIRLNISELELAGSYESEVVCLCKCPTIDGATFKRNGDFCVKDCPTDKEAKGDKCIPGRTDGPSLTLLLGAGLGGGGGVVVLAIGLGVAVTLIRRRRILNSRSEQAKRKRREEIFDISRPSTRYVPDPTRVRPPSEAPIYEPNDIEDGAGQEIYENVAQTNTSGEQVWTRNNIQGAANVQQSEQPEDEEQPVYVNTSYVRDSLEQAEQNQGDRTEIDAEVNNNTDELYLNVPSARNSHQPSTTEEPVRTSNLDEELVYENDEIIEQIRQEQENSEDETYELVGFQ